MSVVQSRAMERKHRGKGVSEVVVHILSEEPSVASEELALSKVFRPVVLSLTSFGLIWRQSSGYVDLHTLHCCLVLMFAWYNVAHYFVVYNRQDSFEDSQLLVKLTGHISAVQEATSLTAFVYFNQKHVPFFLRQWENYKLKHGGLSLKCMRKCLTRRIIVANVLMILYLTGPVLVNIFRGGASDKHIKALVPVMVYTPESLQNIIRFIWTIVFFYIVMGWLQTVIVATSMCALLSNEFKQLTQDFSGAVTNNSRLSRMLPKIRRSSSQGTLFGRERPILSLYEVEQNRLRHLDLALLVSRLDKIMHAYLFMVYLFGIPLIVLLVFGAGGYYRMAIEDFVTYVDGMIGLLLFSIILVWISHAGTRLATAAKGNTSIVQKIDLTTCSLEEAMSIQLYLHKISHEHIGLTLGTVINIDRPLFMTLFTVIITYLGFTLKLTMAIRGNQPVDLGQGLDNITATTII